MNCPMKELLKETVTNTSKTSVDASSTTAAATTTAATKTTSDTKTSVNVSTGRSYVNSRVYASAGRDCVNRCMDRPAAGKNGVNISDGRSCVGPACRDCCALLAFKYIAVCEDVVEFQRKAREVMGK